MSDCHGAIARVTEGATLAPRLYASIAFNDASASEAQCKVRDDAFSDLGGYLETALDPLIAKFQEHELPACLMAVWIFGYTVTGYNAGPTSSEPTSSANPYNQVQHEQIAGRSYLDQIAPALASRALEHVVLYGGPAHFTAGTSVAELDRFTEVAEDAGASPAFDLQNGLDFTATTLPQRDLVRRMLTKGLKGYGEPWGEVDEPLLSGWDDFLAGAFATPSYAATAFADPGTFHVLASLRAVGARAYVDIDGSHAYAQRLAAVELWMGRGYDVGVEFGGLVESEIDAIMAAAAAIRADFLASLALTKGQVEGQGDGDTGAVAALGDCPGSVAAVGCCPETTTAAPTTTASTTAAPTTTPPTTTPPTTSASTTSSTTTTTTTTEPPTTDPPTTTFEPPSTTFPPSTTEPPVITGAETTTFVPPSTTFPPTTTPPTITVVID